MRKYIFSFTQDVLLKNKITVNEALILDYIIQFTSYPGIKTIRVDGEKYYWISYKKILDDLPILDIKKRRLGGIFVELQNKGFIKFINYKNQYTYVKVNDAILNEISFEDTALNLQEHWEEESDYAKFLSKYDICRINTVEKNLSKDYTQYLLSYGFLGKEGSNFLHTSNVRVAEKCNPHCKKLRPIVNYYNNKILIYVSNARKDCKIDFSIFYSKLKEELKYNISNLTYNMCFEDSVFQIIDEHMATISFKYPNIIFSLIPTIDEAVETVVERLVRSKNMSSIYE